MTNITKTIQVSTLAIKLLKKSKISEQEVLRCSKLTRKALKKESLFVHKLNTRAYKHVKFLACFSQINSPFVTKYSAKSASKPKKIKYIKNVSIGLIKDGIDIRCFNIVDKEVIKQIESIPLGTLLEFEGVFINMPIDEYNSIPFFLINKINQNFSFTSFIECSETMHLEAERIINEEKDLKKFIKSALVKCLNIKGLNETPKLELALDFSILQALSGGMENSASGKLHSYLIGSPASGKKLITEAIKILNPIHESASSGKLTIAGISASTTSKDGNWKSNPGALVKAHLGTLTCQDYHNTPKGIQPQIMGIFAEVMENAEFKDTTAANQPYKALTALHLDTNKHSDLDKKFEGDFQEDIHNIPINILSRFDSIIEIEANSQRQLSISLEMLGEENDTTTNEEEILLIRLIIAKLKDLHSQIIISKNTRKQLQRLHEELFSNISSDPFNSDLGSFHTRTGISALKLVRAITCLNSQKKSKPEYAMEAYTYIQEKFKVISNITPDSCKTSKLSGCYPTTTELVHWIREEWKKEEFTFCEISRAVKKDYSIEGDEEAIQRTLRRRLKNQVKKVKKHRYRLMTE